MPKYYRPTPEAVTAISDYSKTFYTHTLDKSDPDENYVSSPFGSWLLLAVLAASTDFTGVPENEESVTATLGMTPAEAGITATDILENLNGAELGIGVWFDPEWAAKAPRITSWLKANTLGTTENRVPPQEEMDAWTREVTHGLIEKFPVEIKPELMFLVASVVYTKFEWNAEYDIVDSTGILSKWGTQQSLYLAEAPVLFYSAGDSVFAVHHARAEGGQVVYSASLVSGEVSEVTLLDYVQRVASNRLGDDITRISTNQLAVSSPEFIDVPRGDSVVSLVWSEYDDEASPRNSVFLPAWEANSTHDLADTAFGFFIEAETLSIDFPEYDGFTAQQTAVAKYGAKGFEAAAVTAFGMMRASAAFHRPEGAYRATVSFSRPFVAVCFIGGLPLFGAVIRKAVEA